MYHDQKKKWMGRLYALYDVWNMSREDIAQYGDPWQIAKAHTIKTPKKDWVGGEGDCDSTLDIGLLVASQSGNEDYLVVYKLGPQRNGEKLDIINQENYSKHFCKYEGYENGISRLPGPCKHKIAGRLFLEENLKKISGLEMKRIYHDYTKPRRFWVRNKYDRIIMSYYDFLSKRSDIDSIQKRDLFYSFLYYYPR